MRITKYQFDGGDLEVFKLSLYSTSKANPEVNLVTIVNAVHAALGYLSTWAMDGDLYAECTIHLNGDSEIIATYRQRDGVKIQYQIGAVWHGTSFGFHS